jgi:hypothetical protein
MRRLRWQPPREQPRKRRDESTAEAAAKPDLNLWKPKTVLGKKVKDKEIVNVDEILDPLDSNPGGRDCDTLLNLEQDLILIGQSKGKFGGGARRIFRQTQKKTKEGNKPKFSTIAVLGDKDGHLGIGLGKAKETVPAGEGSKECQAQHIQDQERLRLMAMRMRQATLDTLQGHWQVRIGRDHLDAST